MTTIKSTTIFFLPIFLFSHFVSQAQNEYNYSSIDLQKDHPAWVIEMYKENADPAVVNRLYQDFYKKNTFYKNQHTQYYKRWMRELSRQVVYSPTNERRRQSSGDRMGDWSCIGPWDWDHDAAGRSYAPGSAHVYTVEQSISNPDVLYCGTATAGIWKTIDRGMNWVPLTYDYDVNSVYAIEIDHTNPDVVYAPMYSSIYKTTDGGATWAPTGDASFQSLSFGTRDIIMDPDNPNIVFAATSIGLYRTNDAGNSWSLITSDDHQEIEIHPTNHDTIYTVRKVSDNTIFSRSFDNGLTFVDVVGTGWPADVGSDIHQRRAEIDVSLDNPNLVIAHLTGQVNGGSGLFGMYKSLDAGASWTFECCGPQPGGMPDLPNGNYNIMAWAKDGSDNGGQFYYNVAMGLSPFNADSMWAAGTNLWVSGDQGSSFICEAKWSEPGLAEYVHADIHDFNYYAHTGEIWVASDGGIFYSNDNGDTFSRRNNGIEGTDFWGFDQGYWEGDIMLGGTYHNGTLLKENNVYVNDWICTDGGDGNYGLVNPGRPKNVHGWFNMKFLKSDRTITPVTRGVPREANASYITGEDSDVLFHPQYFDSWIVGSDTAIYETFDNGINFDHLYSFDHKVVAMARGINNPNILYASTWPGWWDAKQLWRSVDKGLTWTNITPDNALLNGNTWVPYDIVVDPKDATKVTIARTSQYGDTNLSGRWLFTSTDGGSTWTNISGSELSTGMTNLQPYYAVDGGLLVGTRKEVFYKDNSMTEFMNITSDLPVSTASEKLFPYYRKNSIRNATNRSVWERTIPTTHNQVIARPSTNSDEVFCNTDTVRFVDLSVVSEDGVSYQWYFEGGSPSISNDRNPKVIFSKPGEYDVTLIVTDNYASDTITIGNMITVHNDCDVNDEPRQAFETTTAGQYGRCETFDLYNVDSMTIMAWVKPSQIQDDFSAIFMNDGTAAGLNFREGNNTLGYHWPGGEWWWDSNLQVPVGEWSHVAMVVTPNSVTLYLNGVGITHNINLQSVDFLSPRIASYQGWNSRNYKGQLEELAIFDTALSQEEIRRQRHITKDPSADSRIVGYYKFDGGAGLKDESTYDRSFNIHGQPSFVLSDAPVGNGKSDLQNINASGSFTFPNTAANMVFSGGSLPDGDVVISHLYTSPSKNPPTSDPILSKGYFIINNYGTNQTFTGLQTISLGDIGTISNSMASQMTTQLFHRAENSGMPPTWGDNYTPTATFAAGNSGLITLNNTNAGIVQFGEQWMISRSEVENGIPNVSVSPRYPLPPVKGGGSAELLIESPNQAATLPTMDSTMIINLYSPSEGSLVYDESQDELVFYDGTTWNSIKSYDASLNHTGGYFPRPQQVSMSTTSTNYSSLLNLKDANGVVVLPIYTNGDLPKILDPVARMMIYNSDSKAIMLFDDTSWKNVRFSPLTYTSNGSYNVVDGFAIGQGSKSESAAMQVSSSNNKTLSITNVEVTKIQQPEKGMIAYDSVLKGYYFFNGARWLSIKLELE